MPASRNCIAKLVSADKLVAYKPLTDGHRPTTINNRFIMPLSPVAEMTDPLDTMRTHQRCYRIYNTEYNEQLRVFIHEYREVL